MLDTPLKLPLPPVSLRRWLVLSFALEDAAGFGECATTTNSMSSMISVNRDGGGDDHHGGHSDDDLDDKPLLSEDEFAKVGARTFRLAPCASALNSFLSTCVHAWIGALVARTRCFALTVPNTRVRPFLPVPRLVPSLLASLGSALRSVRSQLVSMQGSPRIGSVGASSGSHCLSSSFPLKSCI